MTFSFFPLFATGIPRSNSIQITNKEDFICGAQKYIQYYIKEFSP